MQPRGKLMVAIAIGTAFIAYQFLVHKITVAGQLTAASVSLILIPFVLAVTWAMAVELSLRLALVILSALILSGLAAVKLFGLPHPAIIFGLPHLVTNLFLMWFFARTLIHGRESLITAIARRVHGTLTPELEIYTRRVTWAWSLFFALQILVSIGLFFFATMEIWSTFINILNAPLIVLMFVCEYTYRLLRYRNHHSSPFDGLEIFSGKAQESKPAKVR